jgi:hypothetical protein
MKKESTYSDFREGVVVLDLQLFINLGKLWEEFCIIKPPIALYLSNESKQTLSVSDKLCQRVLAVDSELPNVAQLLSLILSISVCSAYME